MKNDFFNHIRFYLQEELETLRSKLDKTENERSHYKNENERLESKVSFELISNLYSLVSRGVSMLRINFFVSSGGCRKN